MTDSYADLFGMLASTPRLTGALCRGHAPLWDYDEADDDDPSIERFLVNRCRACPALAACSAWVESLPPSQRPLGVTGAVMRREPKSRRRRASAARVEDLGVEDLGVEDLGVVAS